MEDVLSLLQWPAMLITLVAAWLVAAQSKRKRSWGFWWFVVSNVLWVIWGWYDVAYALIAYRPSWLFAAFVLYGFSGYVGYVWMAMKRRRAAERRT